MASDLQKYKFAKRRLLSIKGLSNRTSLIHRQNLLQKNDSLPLGLSDSVDPLRTIAPLPR